MVNWTLLQNATSPDNKPTPGWLFNEICVDVRSNPMDSSDVAEYLMQCVCSDQLNIQLKAVLTIKHLSAEVIMFQQYMQTCNGALKILQDIAAPPIVPQARSLEPPEVKTVRDATQSCLDAIHTPHTLEKQTESAHLKERIQGFGNFEPPAEEEPKKATVTAQVSDFVADSIGDMVDDFRDKGAVGALKDATVDALDLVLDGVDAVWGWVAGKGDEAPRICQPQNQFGPGAGGFKPTTAQPPGGFAPPPVAPTSAGSHYAAAFGGSVVGANNPVMLSSGAGSSKAPPASAPKPEEKPEPKAPPPAPMVDLLSMDEEPKAAGKTGAGASPVTDLLDLEAAPPQAAQPGLLDF